MTADIINALFEFIGGCFILLSVSKLIKDKVVKGIDWRTTGFFFAWGAWNLYFYPSLGQVWSFIAGIYMVLCNLLWVILLIYYGRKE